MEQNPADNNPNPEFESFRLFLANYHANTLPEVREERSSYFAQQATEEMDRLWDERGWSNMTMEEWLNTST